MPKNNLPTQPNHTHGYLKNPPRGGKVAILAVIIFVSSLALGTALALAHSANRASVASTRQTAFNDTVIPRPEIVAATATANPSNPKLLMIPSLNILAPFESLGLKTDHTLAVPQNPLSVGWFIYGAKPGEIGAAVIVGHLDSAKGPAVFSDLSKIKPGDIILIKRTDDSVAKYRVDSLSKFSQDNFPTKAVYGPIEYAGIRLITCSGTWDKKAGHYTENLVVFGTKI